MPNLLNSYLFVSFSEYRAGTTMKTPQIYLLVLVALMLLSACIVNNNTVLTSSTLTQTPIIMVMATNSDPNVPVTIATERIITPIKTMTSSFFPTIIPLHSSTPTQPLTITPESTDLCRVPTVFSNRTQSLLSMGSILVEDSQENGMWALSRNLMEPHFIPFSVEPIGRIYLSPNKTQIMLQRVNETVVLYNLLTEEEQIIPWQENWMARSTSGWTEDGLIKLFISSNDTLGEGVVKETLLLDPLTHQVELLRQAFYLPGYVFNSTTPFQGFAVWDPSETAVFYTAYHPEQSFWGYILQDIVNDVELWRSDPLDAPYIIPPADWSTDGNKILLAVNRESNTPDSTVTELASLTINDLHYEVLAHLTFLTGSESEVRYLAWSPNTRYVFFALWPTTFSGPGYILDTFDSSIYQICDPDFVDGWWLSATNQLLYIVETSSGQWELKLLDVTSWQSQVVWYGEQYPYFVEWTPVEFLNPQ